MQAVQVVPQVAVEATSALANPATRGSWLRVVAGYTVLILSLTLTFWLSPGPRTEAEYCGTYLHLTSWAGFTANCDGFVYMEDARHPAHLLEPREVRQSRPLFILLGTAVGYPCTWVVQGLQRSGLLPEQFVQKLPAKYQPLLGFYIGYVLLNYGVLLGALLLFRHLYYRLTAGQGSALLLLALSVVLVSNQVTKAFFWTVHQQMFTFLVPLVLVYVVLQLREQARWRACLPALAVAGGILALVYGSFVLLLPVVLYGLWLQRQQLAIGRALLRAALLLLLFAAPTLLWIGLLKLRGVTYYNHEAEAYGQLVWLRAAWEQPFANFLQLAGRNFRQFLGTLSAVGLFLAAGAGLVLWRQMSGSTPYYFALLGAVLLMQSAFLAGLGYYKERLTWMLVPVLLLMVAAAATDAPERHRPWLTGVALCSAGIWHIWQVVSYGPFS